MRRIFQIDIIMFSLVAIHFLSVCEYNPAHAQVVQNTSTSEPNLSDLLKIELEQLEAKIKHLQEHPEEVNKPQIIDFNEMDEEKIIAQQIEDNNILYKDKIFGNPFKEIAMSIEPIKDEYKIGDEIEISCLFKSFSDENLYVPVSRGNPLRDFGYALYFSDGSPVPKSDSYKSFEADFNKQPSVRSRSGFQLRPGDIAGAFLYKIGRFFEIEKEGIYSLIIMRNITGEWKDGFMISNMTKIKIVKKQEEQ